MSHQHLMRGMSVLHLRFTVKPLETIVFGNQAGSALRGALYQALSHNFCSEPGIPITPDHKDRCPVCWLLDAENRKDERGENIPRPLTVEPPSIHQDFFNPPHPFSFGLSLIGKAQDMLPYLLRAVQKMGDFGVGKGRGRFRLVNIVEYNPILDAERTLLNNHIVKSPTLQVTNAGIQDALERFATEHITLRFLTPTRLTARNVLVKEPDPSIYMHRLLERCQRLAQYYSEPNPPEASDWDNTTNELLEIADTLEITYDDTEWYEARSGSKRQRRYTPISGIIGTVRWSGDIAPVLPWILWGQSLHVGKNAVKGNGWHKVIR